MKIQSEDYAYSTARIRAMETRLCRRDQLERMADTRTVPELMAQLAEMGLTDGKRDATGVPDGEAVESILESQLRRAFSETSEMLPDPSVLNFCRYPYDCHNLKVAVKCAARGIPTEGRMSGLGTLPPEEILQIVKDVSASKPRTMADGAPLLPGHMEAAVSAAVEQFAKTANPQLVDLILDRACFADMLDGARATGVPFALELVRTRVDLLNLLFAVRIVRRNTPDALWLWDNACLEGGSMETSSLREAVERADAEALAHCAERASYDAFAAALSAGAPLSELERVADNTLLRAARRAREVLCGMEVPLAYLTAAEQNGKNLRIVLTGRLSGLPSGEIRERLRECYV